MPDWLAERGIGESRLVRVEGGEIAEARILLDDVVRAGSVLDARLLSNGDNGRNAVARSASGAEFLLPRGAPGIAEGGALRIDVTREAIPGAEPWKRPLARVTDKALAEAPSPVATALPFPAPDDRLGALGWNDLIEEVRSGIVRFVGGELAIEPTRAMTMIDVDGLGAPGELALLGAAAAARAILRLDLQGSIGIDLPTASGKAARLSAAAAIDNILPQPFERTSVNGFGFIQIVRPRRRASLIELAADRAGFEARALLRRAAFEAAGAKSIVAHARVIAEIECHPGWIAELARQIGGKVALRADPALAMAGGYVE
ncbi:MAG: ribonuclease, partial [Sphingomicrobium sp.]